MQLFGPAQRRHSRGLGVPGDARVLQRVIAPDDSRYDPPAVPQRQLLQRGAAVLLNAPVTVTSHAPGMPHVRATIAKMAKLARAGARSYEIRNLATRITRGVPSKDYRGELAALYKWERDNIRYRKDPVELEWVQSPARTVKEGAGDCDDKATLLAALVGSLGHEWYFDTVGPSSTVQKHVAVVVRLDDGSTVTLDSVLEPATSSTAPRADLGTFGLRAIGAHHLWSSEGKMLGFIGSHVGPRGRKLWDWNPYYPPVGVTALHSGRQPPQGGVLPEQAPTYRLQNAPGHWNRRAPQSPYSLCGPFDAMDPGELGSFLSFVKKIGKSMGKAVHFVGKLARNPIVQGAANVVVPGAGAAIAKAGATEGKLRAAFKSPGALVSALPFPGGAGPVSALVHAGATAATKAATKKLAAKHKPNPSVRAKYPKNARQVWDGRFGVYRVYVPRAGVAGLGAFRPSIAFSLGASSSSSAGAAVAAVRAYVAQHKAAPTVAVAAVRQFQAEDGVLTVDGKWGPNSRKAAAWYLGAAEATLPAVATAFAKTKITWHPPVMMQQPAPAAPVHAAAAPVAVRAARKPAPAPVSHLPPPAPPGTPAVVPPVALPGYTEVGHESSNPGLAPVPAAAAPAAAALPPVVHAVPVATTPATAVLVAKAPTKPKAKKRVAAPPAVASFAVPVLPAAGVVDVTGAGVPAGFVMPAPMMPAGPGPGGSASWAELQQGGSEKQDNTAIWLAVAYLYYRQQRSRRAA